MKNFFLKIFVFMLYFNINWVSAGIKVGGCGCLPKPQDFLLYEFYCCKYSLKSEGEKGPYYYAFFGASAGNTFMQYCNHLDLPNIKGIPSNNCTKYDKVFNNYGTNVVYNSIEYACKSLDNYCSKNETVAVYQ